MSKDRLIFKENYLVKIYVKSLCLNRSEKNRKSISPFSVFTGKLFFNKRGGLDF